mgnify:FL=1
MAKKLKGDQFLLSANDLVSGKVVFYSESGWIVNSRKAIKIAKKDIEKYNEIIEKEERKCLIVSAEFVELEESGEIKTLRDKIRNSGLTIKI